MLTGTIFGVFIIPVLYIIFQTLQEKFNGKKKPDEMTVHPVTPALD
jgi:HAE1 family hydrophobic/amphiphilic exporter-1